MSEAEPGRTGRGSPHTTAVAEILREPVVDGMVAGRALRLCRSATYRALRNGEIPSFKINGQYRCPTPKLREMLGFAAEPVAA